MFPLEVPVKPRPRVLLMTAAPTVWPNARRLRGAAPARHVKGGTCSTLVRASSAGSWPGGRELRVGIGNKGIGRREEAGGRHPAVNISATVVPLHLVFIQEGADCDGRPQHARLEPLVTEILHRGRRNASDTSRTSVPRALAS